MVLNKKFLVLALTIVLSLSVVFLNIETLYVSHESSLTNVTSQKTTAPPSAPTSAPLSSPPSQQTRDVNNQHSQSQSQKSSFTDNQASRDPKAISITSMQPSPTYPTSPTPKVYLTAADSVSQIPLSCPSIDIVYTWVNGSDPIHQKNRALRTERAGLVQLNQGPKFEQRFRDFGTLRYSLRSIKKFVPFVKNVWIITDNQVPNWFNTEYGGNIHFIDHRQLFSHRSDLPTFNSNGIESRFFDLPSEVSDCFLYLNDDILFGNNISVTDFYNPETQAYAIFPGTETAPRTRPDSSWDFSVNFSNNLLDRIWGDHRNRYFTDHGVQFYNRNIFKKMYEEIGLEMDYTAANPFRTGSDTQIPFLFQQYAFRYFKTFKQKGFNDFIMLKDNQKNMKDAFAKAVREKYKTICLNDDLSLNPPKAILDDLYSYLNSFLSTPGEWEK